MNKKTEEAESELDVVRSWIRDIKAFVRHHCTVPLIIFGLSLFPVGLKELHAWFPQYTQPYVDLIAAAVNVVEGLNDEGQRLPKSISAGLIAAFCAVIQLAMLLGIDPLLRVGSKVWVFGYAYISFVIASLTFWMFHNADVVTALGSAGPLAVGIFYPSVLFRYLGKFDLQSGENRIATQGATSDESSSAPTQSQQDLQHLHSNILAIAVAGIRRNSLRYWAYVSDVLFSIPEDDLSRILLDVLVNDASMPDQSKRAQYYKDVVAQRMLRKLDGTDDETPESEFEDTTHKPLKKWTVWEFIDRFHQLGSPELVLDAVTPNREARWLMALMPVGELRVLVNDWLMKRLDDDEQVLLEKAISDAAAESSNYEEERTLIIRAVDRHATREFYDNIVCEYRKRRFRCRSFPMNCWQDWRRDKHCDGCKKHKKPCSDCR